MIEEWKWIKNYEGIYMVSSLGRVKSFREHKDGYILSNKNQTGDYLRVNLYDKNRRLTTKGIHVLVASAFIGDIPAGHQVHHIDGNKQNNAVSNLSIVHPRDHRAETLKTRPQILSGMVTYNKHVRPKEIQQYTIDGILVASYPNAKEAGLATGVCARNILQVARGTPFNTNGNTRKQAGGYVWKFKKEREVMMCDI